MYEERNVEHGGAQVASVAGSADEQVQSLELQLEAGRIQIEDLERQAALIAALPREDRRILALRFEEGMKIRQIAAVLYLEPRRLYRRYLVSAPRFVWLLFTDWMRSAFHRGAPREA